MPEWLETLPADASADDRRDLGRAARVRLPRRAIAQWSPPADRPSAVALLRQQEETRIPALVPVRHHRMAASPLAFFRGSAVVMASDLGRSANTGLETMLCGDAHLSNFGVFGSAEHNVVFDVNDFDEVAPGPFEWDLMRLTTSFVLTAEEQTADRALGANAARLAADSYQQQIRVAAQSSRLANWYQMFTPEQIVSFSLERGGKKQERESKELLRRNLARIKSRDAWSAIRKLTEIGPDGQRQFINQPPLLVRLSVDSLGVDLNVMYESFLNTLAPEKRALLGHYRILDLAHKVVGVGSVGLPAIVALLEGSDPSDLLAMQLKAAQASVLEPWTKRAPFEQHGQRVVTGQRFMQASGDPFLGWVRSERREIDLYGRQLRDFKWSVDLAGLGPERLMRYAALCGATLAMAHARVGDPQVLQAYMGGGTKFAKAMTQFAVSYAALAVADYHEFVDSVADEQAQTPPSQELDEATLASYSML